MTEDQRLKILDELLELSEERLLQPDEFTMAMFRKRSGLSAQSTISRMGRMIRAGLIEEVDPVFHNGRIQRAFRRVRPDRSGDDPFPGSD
jgi:hypothetical protein